MRRTVALALLLGALGACESAGPPGAGGGGATVTTADPQVEFARCLRSKGFEVPDPAPAPGGGPVGATGFPAPRDAGEEQAVRDCMAQLAPAGGQSGGDNRRADGPNLLEFARCMRDHGIDFPDPRPRPDGSLELPSLPDPSSSGYARAHEACRHLGGVDVSGGSVGITGRAGRG